jgi:hypothetical protein
MTLLLRQRYLVLSPYVAYADEDGLPLACDEYIFFLENRDAYFGEH